MHYGTRQHFSNGHDVLYVRTPYSGDGQYFINKVLGVTVLQQWSKVAICQTVCRKMIGVSDRFSPDSSVPVSEGHVMFTLS